MLFNNKDLIIIKTALNKRTVVCSSKNIFQTYFQTSGLPDFRTFRLHSQIYFGNTK